MLFKVGQNRGLNFTRYVTLQHPGCISEGTIMHELLHALGIVILYFFNFIASKFSTNRY